uniref:Uncharacterized protein n=1 Tax=Rhizophagus irregularis (strain DAOM 181602 / DAOM 197198 / MUCL 43194) TaxID=747089 RepID=U9U1G6_RHIID
MRVRYIVYRGLTDGDAEKRLIKDKNLLGNYIIENLISQRKARKNVLGTYRKSSGDLLHLMQINNNGVMRKSDYPDCKLRDFRTIGGKICWGAYKIQIKYYSLKNSHRINK